jgi:hypothetical protein
MGADLALNLTVAYSSVSHNWGGGGGGGGPGYPTPTSGNVLKFKHWILDRATDEIF